MDCQTVTNSLYDLFDDDMDKEKANELLQHIQKCPACKREYISIKQTIETLESRARVAASPDFCRKVMAGINHEAGRSQKRSRWIRITLLAAAFTGILVAIPLYRVFIPRPTQASSIFSEAIEASAKIRSLHIQARMRTIPQDNFEMINVEYDFVPIEIWKDFSGPTRWRIEKPGRVVVMNGSQQTLYIKPPINMAAVGGKNVGFVTWLRSLLDPQELLSFEQELALKQNDKYEVKADTAQGGTQSIILTVDAKAQGNLSNPWLRNKLIMTTDNRRVYRFDTKSKRLKKLQMYVDQKSAYVLLFETTSIEYDQDQDPALFILQLPDDVIRYKEFTQADKDTFLSNLTAQEVAGKFWQACADENWDEALKYYASTEMLFLLKKMYGGVEVVSVGVPFKSGPYPGVFVPYEIRLKSGETKKYNLAIRNDNPAKRWVVDGGL
jgi:hypothetical protein